MLIRDQLLAGSRQPAWRRDSEVKTIIAALVAGAVPAISSADVTGWSLSIDPLSAVDLQQVFARISVNQTCAMDPARVSARQDGTTIVLTVPPADPSCVPIGATTTADVLLGQFHVGQFSVVVQSSDGAQLTSGSFQVSKPSARVGPLIQFTDLWWNPSESGWGISVTHHADGLLFAAWYTYDSSGAPTWFTLQPGAWTSTRTFAGPIYKTTGPWYGSAFDPAKVTVAQVGTGTITFDDPAHATFSYTVSGVSGTTTIQRMQF